MTKSTKPKAKKAAAGKSRSKTEQVLIFWDALPGLPSPR